MFEYELKHDPSYTLGEAYLDNGDSITVEAGSMVSHTQNVDMKTHSSAGGVVSSIKKSVLSGEEFFRNTFTATSNDERVTFAHTQPGDMEDIEMENETLYVQSGSYVASGPEIETDTASGGLSSLLGGKGLFFLEATGKGPLFVGSYGGIFERELGPDETLTVDTGHSVAWEESVEWSTTRVGGLKSTVFSGEGMVLKFTGPGTVYLQTRDYDTFIGEIASRVSTDD